jgi:hypothetical protein
VASIFTKLGLPPDESDNRRVLAVLHYLGSPALGVAGSAGPISPRSVARLPVDRLADQIGVSQVSRVLLDHVHQDPP